MTVYYPVEDTHVRVVVSSVKGKAFTAKFIDDEEPAGLYPWDNYVKTDIDLYYDKKTREPLDFRTKK